MKYYLLGLLLIFSACSAHLNVKELDADFQFVNYLNYPSPTPTPTVQ